QDGKISLVEVVSQIGGTLRLTNPWPGQPVTLSRGGPVSQRLSGATLSIATSKGERIVLAKGTVPGLRGSARCTADVDRAKEIVTALRAAVSSAFSPMRGRPETD